jgi:tetratricopeptide (TPR) repeat protein
MSAPSLAVTCPDENTLLAFIDGRLTPPALSHLASHLESCPSCSDVVAGAAPALLSGVATKPGSPGERVATDGGAASSLDLTGNLARGAAIGRYLILSLVGRGGMGEVYAAYDPELDRKIALKLLHDGAQRGDDAVRARSRLLREAKAIARLSHPNVVVVHDAGTVGERVFIAMEFVEGQTLAGWVAARPRTWREVRDLFMAAGRALAAAHAAGLVHRDFKPQNVMVGVGEGAQRQVRVMDFGLARDSLDGAAEGHRGDRFGMEASELPPDQSLGLTRTGALVGTPAYMAPEQFLGERADPRTDQFSFCVALHEALYGQRPFPDVTLAALTVAVIEGRVREPPNKGRVPAWLRRVVLRGLETKRADRFASMEDLLRALDRDPERKRRRVLAAAGVAALLLAGGAVGQRTASQPSATFCRGAADKLQGVWEEAALGPTGGRRAATRTAFLATGKSIAADSWERVAKILDGYATRWQDMFTDACRATHLRGEQSAEVLDLRMECLNRSLGGLRALVDIFARADGEVVVQAVNAAGSLPDLERCADLALLKAVVPPPGDANLRARVEETRRRTAELKASHDTGLAAEAVRRADALVGEVRDLPYLPAKAEALLQAGLAHDANAPSTTSSRVMEEAFWTALRSRQDELAASAASVLAGRIGYDSSSKENAHRWVRLGEALLDRLGAGHERTRSWLLQAHANIALIQHRLPEARQAYQQAIALKKKVLGPAHPDVAISIGTLSLALLEGGDLEGALEAVTQALQIFERAYGADSPLNAMWVSNQGEVLNALGRPKEAIPRFQRAIDLWATSSDADNPSFAYPLTGMGQALLLEKRAAEAIAPLERALRLRERYDPDPQRLAETRFALARALWDGGGDRAQARAHAAAARDGYARMAWRKAELATAEAWLAAHRRR